MGISARRMGRRVKVLIDGSCASLGGLDDAIMKGKKDGQKEGVRNGW